MEALLTEHGESRMRKRLGLKRKATSREAEKALERGARHSQFSGSFRRYLDGVFLSQGKANNMRVYNGSLYLFDRDTLITCWPLPQKFRNVKAHAI